MKTFFFFLVLMIFVVCITSETTNKPEEETKMKMMIIENHLTGEIDTFWFDDSLDHNHYIIKNKSGELLKIQIEVDSLDSLKIREE